MVRGNRFISQITGKVRLWVVLSGLLMATTLFGMFVWPTRYRYDKMNVQANAVVPVRIDRITGKTEILYPSGWQLAAAASDPDTELPPAELEKISVGQGEFGGMGISSRTLVYVETVRVPALQPNAVEAVCGNDRVHGRAANCS